MTKVTDNRLIRLLPEGNEVRYSQRREKKLLNFLNEKLKTL